MDQFFIEGLGFSQNMFAFVILPALIFVARVAEVSVNTIRIIYMLGGRRTTATLMGFFEAFIWLVAIRQIFQHLDNWAAYVAYPGGFAAGILVGMIIEDRIAYGKVIVRIISNEDVRSLIKYLDWEDFRYTQVSAEGPEGKENLVFTVLERDRLDDLLKELKVNHPNSYFTVESVKTADESNAFMERGSFSLFTFLRGVLRN